MKTIEIDHNGAYHGACECFKSVSVQFLAKFVPFGCRITHFKSLRFVCLHFDVSGHKQVFKVENKIQNDLKVWAARTCCSINQLFVTTTSQLCQRCDMVGRFNVADLATTADDLVKLRQNYKIVYKIVYKNVYKNVCVCVVFYRENVCVRVHHGRGRVRIHVRHR